MEKNEKNKLLSILKETTPARIGVGRTGTRPLTKDYLSLRIDHSAAVDSVYGEVSDKLLKRFNLFVVDTCFGTKEQYLTRPDLGKVFSKESQERILKNCVKKPTVQIVISDGLSANAINENMMDVYPALLDSLEHYHLKLGTPFFVRGGRVACMNMIGELLEPEAFVLLIGERPGLVCAHSLSAYMCYKPRMGTKESDRMVISNIHSKGTTPIEAAAHIGTIVNKMIKQKQSGINLII